MALLYTIGHSTRPLADLVEALQAHTIQTLVDIRAFPMSRRLPQFNREALEKSLPAPEFNRAMGELVSLAETSRTAYMCAERIYFRCHRMLVSDWLMAHGHDVMHIDGSGTPKPHQLTAEARMIDGELIYRGDKLL